MRFKDESLSFEIKEKLEMKLDLQIKKFSHSYPALTKKFGSGDFQLRIVDGEFSNEQILVLLGENGTGKTTFLKILAGLDKEFKD